MRVLFFGNSSFSVPVLEALVDAGLCVAGVVMPITSRRGMSPWRRRLELGKRAAARTWARLPSSLGPRSGAGFNVRMASLAARAGAPLLSPGRVGDAEVVDRLRRLRSDVVVMAGFDQILGPRLLATLGPVLNVHPSLLPSYRGPEPHFWMVKNGETAGGVSVHLVDAGIDSGPILAQERFTIEPWTTGGELYERASRTAGALATRVLRELRAGTSGSAEQDGASSYFGPIAPEHTAVAFGEPLAAAYNRARAGEPAHGSWVWVPHELARGEHEAARAALVASPDVTTLRLHAPSAFPGARIGPPGTVRREGAGALVQCVDGALLFRGATGGVGAGVP